MSPSGCRSERSTLPRRPLPRDVNRAGSAPPDQDRNRLRWFRTKTTSTQDAFGWFNLRPCGRNRLTRALFYNRPRSPRTLLTHCESALLVQGNEPPHEATSQPTPHAFRRASRRRGRCVYPTSATDSRHEHPADRAILESPKNVAFARSTASAASIGDSESSGASFDDEPPASVRANHGSRYPEQPSPVRSCGP